MSLRDLMWSAAGGIWVASAVQNWHLQRYFRAGVFFTFAIACFVMAMD